MREWRGAIELWHCTVLAWTVLPPQEHSAQQRVPGYGGLHNGNVLHSGMSHGGLHIGMSRQLRGADTMASSLSSCDSTSPEAARMCLPGMAPAPGRATARGAYERTMSYVCTAHTHSEPHTHCTETH